MSNLSQKKSIVFGGTSGIGLEIAKLFKVVLTVHDEIVFLIPERNADKHFQKALAIAQKAPKWAPGLPVAAEGLHAPEYAK